jgi:outer membrane protein
MTKIPRYLTLVALIGTLSAPGSVFAGSIMDYIRKYDLNDYAFGVAFSVSQSPYLGRENSTFAYPMLTSFRDPAFTDDWLVLSDGNLGVRWVSEGGWELGVMGRIQTLGTGNSDAPELSGLDSRQWGLEIGPTIGWRAWPVHLNFNLYTELLGRHDGLTSDLAFSLPREWDRGFFVPAFELIHRDADYTDYYFGVSPAESLPTRPEYQAGSSLSYALAAHWGYALTDKWLLSGRIGIEFLDSEISDSPIVGDDSIWSTNISIAYNANIFQPRVSDRTGPRQPQFEFRLGAFKNNIDSKIVRDSSAGVPGSEIDLDDLLGISAEETVIQLDAIFRIGVFHRLEFGYFEMSRNGVATLPESITVAEETFSAGATVNSSFESEVLRFSYAYSLMNDDQKELGVMAGLHYSRFSVVIEDPDSGQRVASSTSTPLPVIGLHGAVALGQKMILGARIQIFRMDFDQFEGSLNYATLDLQRHFGENFSVGLGYNYYAFKLDSSEDSSRGTLEVRHRGPVLFLSAHF